MEIRVKMGMTKIQGIAQQVRNHLMGQKPWGFNRIYTLHKIINFIVESQGLQHD